MFDASCSVPPGSDFREVATADSCERVKESDRGGGAGPLA